MQFNSNAVPEYDPEDSEAKIPDSKAKGEEEHGGGHVIIQDVP